MYVIVVHVHKDDKFYEDADWKLFSSGGTRYLTQYKDLKEVHEAIRELLNKGVLAINIKFYKEIPFKVKQDWVIESDFKEA